MHFIEDLHPVVDKCGFSIGTEWVETKKSPAGLDGTLLREHYMKMKKLIHNYNAKIRV